jgi:phosphopantothenoylcysteine synthetase/decarboxylase
MPKDLSGRRILITSGPTRADIDAVRFVSNRSSGALGCRIALEALARGAEVALVAGAGSIVPERRELTEDEARRLRVLPVETVSDLLRALEAELTGETAPHAILHAMAVLDYVPAETSAEKTPSGRDEWTLRLVRSPKVIRSIREWAPRACLVQFKLEVGLTEEALIRAALDSLKGNRADLVVANDLTQIRGEAHPALILSPDGEVLARPRTKAAIARALCDVLTARLHHDVSSW